MSSDKRWIYLSDRLSDEYWKGVRAFINLAGHHLNEDGNVKCLCKKCYNRFWRPLDTLEAHIIDNGFNTNYSKWIYHGEDEVYQRQSVSVLPGSSMPEHDEMEEALHDLTNKNNLNDDNCEGGNQFIPDDDSQSFDKLFAGLQSELWPGCSEISVFNFLVKLMHIKVLNKWTDKSFDMLCDLLKIALPQNSKIPASYYEAKKQLRSLGLGYESIHVCKYDCVLFWKEHANRQDCPICGFTRWAKKTSNESNIPHKVLRYFPLKGRLRRLFSSRHTAQHMTWHVGGKSTEVGVMRHPVDGQAWRDFDRRFPSFASDPRNIRLGLAEAGLPIQ